jgi:hypothetical protein
MLINGIAVNVIVFFINKLAGRIHDAIYSGCVPSKILLKCIIWVIT